MDNLAIFITCRNKSTRLKNKALLKLYDEISYFDYILRRCQNIKTNCIKILSTSYANENKILIDKSLDKDFFFFQGSEEDKLNRWLHTAIKYNVKFFITIDGDDPFFDPSIVDLAFNQYLNNNYDFIKCSNIIPGLFTYGIKFETLKKVCKIKDTSNTEMMWVYFEKMAGIKIKDLNSSINSKFLRQDIRLTLDYQEDHIFMNTLINKYNKDKFKITSLEILKILEDNPDISLINKGRINDWKKNQKLKTIYKIKND
tara:strand:- start:797 stop:1567 length:771 start_codon:yes stop_codon:yes gene_type:complete